uniref:Uncharacterized protein n=1 Tax=viral metagenome TaxID=1070528 RepID=A0A6C0CGC4_9ZZZZ
MATVSPDEVDELFNRIVSRKLDGTTSSRWTSVLVLLVIVVLVVTATVYYLHKQRKKSSSASVAEPIPKVVVNA